MVVTLLLGRLITETVPLPALVTYAFLVSKAMPDGLLPTLMVVVTVLVTVLIFVTESDPALTTQTRLPSGLCATATGLVPTLTVAITLSVLSRTVTVPEPLLATYAW